MLKSRINSLIRIANDAYVASNGFAQHLTKPVSLQKLLAAIERATAPSPAGP